MTKKILKAKEPVRLRFKQLANGGKSLYLDIYTNGARRYDFLKLYLVPERTAADRLQNEQTMRAANAIKAQRIIAIANGTAGIVPKQGGKVLLLEWLLNYPRTQTSEETQHSYKSTYNVLRKFAPAARLIDIDRAFCLRFIHYLLHEYTQSTGKHLTPASATLYYARFSAAINAAVRAGLIQQSPCAKIMPNEKIKVPAAQRCYLTKEELQKLIAAAPQSKGAAATKQAFLFSCFCGLRISDIKRLKWYDIKESNGQKHIEIVMQKTQEALYIPLSRQALAYMPETAAASPETAVFTEIASPAMINKHLKQLAKAAAIEKNISFHTARHTFATLLLTEGADIYTTSRLLGHTNISTTQVYAKIVDAKKREAVELLDKIG